MITAIASTACDQNTDDEIENVKIESILVVQDRNSCPEGFRKDQHGKCRHML